MEEGASGDTFAGHSVTGDPAAGAPDWGDWENPLRAPVAPTAGTGAPAAPMLHLDGFDGPMDLLLDLAERQRIDWGRMSMLALAEQFVAALEKLRDRVAIERRADWLVMATRLVLLRSRLLFPESPAAAEAAQRDAAAELRRIDDLAEVRAAAAWLSDRPVLAQDVFARGAPDRLGAYVEAEDEVDVIAFLWASLALFEECLRATRYRRPLPPRLDGALLGCRGPRPHPAAPGGGRGRGSAWILPARATCHH